MNRPLDELGDRETSGPALTWTHDASHYPEPLTPLSADIWLASMAHGVQAAAAELRAPFGGFEARTFAGGWAYEHELDPAWEPDPAHFERAALDVAGRWERELRPQVEAITGELRALRPEGPPPALAAELLDRLVRLVREQWRLHFLVVLPVHSARELLHDAYVARFGKADELEPYRLVEGLPNETLAADELLWEVAELARELDVADPLLELPGPHAYERLRATWHGRRVLTALDGYLERYGGRCRLHELSLPREAERPGDVLERVRLFLERPRDLPGERRARESARARLEAEILARIEDADDRRTFAGLLEQVKAAAPLEETHAYVIDYPGLAAVREALLGFARRLLGAGRLDDPDDVFLLQLSELRAAVLEASRAPLQGTVAERRFELEQACRSAPAPFLGPAPAERELPASMAKFYGTPGAASRAGDVLRGTAASPGRASGPARVVRGPEDFARIRSGDVLVCTTTTPAWTPLFASLAGLVTETGGILCHAAVVAREYGLPAVVGASAATTEIPDDARIELDGGTGSVRLLPPEEYRPSHRSPAKGK